MEPPPLPSGPSETSAPMQRSLSTDTNASAAGPKPAFALPYRMVYGVATQDSVLIYDTQQHTPICVVSNLHCATFTDLAWSNDGLTLLISSTDGFCSALAFAPGELCEVYKGETASQRKAREAVDGTLSSQNTPGPTPTALFAPPSPFHASTSMQHRHRDSTSSIAAPSPPPASFFVSQRPSSPARSNSASSIMTQSSLAQTPATSMSNPPPLIGGHVPGLTAVNSGKITGMPMTTPPETPRSNAGSVAGAKRDLSESEKEDAAAQPKRKRIAPTFVSSLNGKGV